MRLRVLIFFLLFFYYFFCITGLFIVTPVYALNSAVHSRATKASKLSQLKRENMVSLLKLVGDISKYRPGITPEISKKLSHLRPDIIKLIHELAKTNQQKTILIRGIDSLIGASLSIRVKRNDTLCSLALKYLGSAKKAHELAKFNKLEPPYVIIPGTILKQPAPVIEPDFKRVFKILAQEEAKRDAQAATQRKAKDVSEQEVQEKVKIKSLISIKEKIKAKKLKMSKSFQVLSVPVTQAKLFDKSLTKFTIKEDSRKIAEDSIKARVQALKVGIMVLDYFFEDPKNKKSHLRSENKLKKKSDDLAKQDLNLAKQDLNLAKQDLNLAKQDLNLAKQDLNLAKQDLNSTKPDLNSTEQSEKETQTNKKIIINKAEKIEDIVKTSPKKEEKNKKTRKKSRMFYYIIIAQAFLLLVLVLYFKSKFKKMPPNYIRTNPDFVNSRLRGFEDKDKFDN